MEFNGKLLILFVIENNVQLYIVLHLNGSVIDIGGPQGSALGPLLF